LLHGRGRPRERERERERGRESALVLIGTVNNRFVSL